MAELQVHVLDGMAIDGTHKYGLRIVLIVIPEVHWRHIWRILFSCWLHTKHFISEGDNLFPSIFGRVELILILALDPTVRITQANYLSLRREPFAGLPTCCMAFFFFFFLQQSQDRNCIVRVVILQYLQHDLALQSMMQHPYNKVVLLSNFCSLVHDQWLNGLLFPYSCYCLWEDPI